MICSVFKFFCAKLAFHTTQYFYHLFNIKTSRVILHHSFSWTLSQIYLSVNSCGMPNNATTCNYAPTNTKHKIILWSKSKHHSNCERRIFMLSSSLTKLVQLMISRTIRREKVNVIWMRRNKIYHVNRPWIQRYEFWWNQRKLIFKWICLACIPSETMENQAMYTKIHVTVNCSYFEPILYWY